MNTIILDPDDENVPMESDAGICEEGTKIPIAGINNNPAPPPHTALNENATNAQTNNMMVEVNIRIFAKFKDTSLPLELTML